MNIPNKPLPPGVTREAIRLGKMTNAKLTAAIDAIYQSAHSAALEVQQEMEAELRSELSKLTNGHPHKIYSIGNGRAPMYDIPQFALNFYDPAYPYDWWLRELI